MHPWRPGEGYLYDLRVELTDGADVVDSYTLPVGVRTVEVRGTQFLINGEPFYFTGFGKHEDADVRGKGHDDALMVHDFALMDWIGANSFRTSHYPYAEEVLDYADRHGIVVIDETAAVGQNLGMMAGILRREFPPTFSPETIDDASREVHAQAIRELVARDKNHPSVVLWSIANEPEADTDASVAYFTPLIALARELDPTRPVGHGQHGLRAARPGPAAGAGRRRHDQPLLRLVRAHRRPRGRGEGAAGRARGVGRGGQADPGHRVRRRHRRRAALGRDPAVVARSTRPTSWRCTTACSTGSTPWSASTSGTSPTSRRRPASAGSPATRRACSPATGTPRRPPSRSAAAGAATPEGAVPTYVALGSSFASGPGIEPILDAGCGRSGNNYAHLVADRLGYDLIDVTSGGATVDDIVARPQTLMTGGTVPPQIEAVVPHTDLVTVTVGGNDVGYLRTILGCSYRADPEGTPVEARPFFATPVDPAAVAAALEALPAKVTGLVTAVRERAPRARVVLVDYLTVVPEPGSGVRRCR